MDDLRKLQLIQTGTLKEIIRLCKENNIQYYLMFGSLLGMVRHKGFIPWDDDLDIAMPRKDYEKFLVIARTQLKSQFFLQTHETDPNYYVCFARVRVNNTTFIPKVYENTSFRHNGIWVDVFPLDNADRNNGAYEKIRYLSMRYVLRPMASIKVTGLPRNAGIKKRILYILSKHISLDTILNWTEQIQTNKNRKESKYFVCFGSPYRMKQNYYLKESFGHGTSMEFEGVQCIAPSDADYVLRLLYGEYMKLPAEEEQVGHLPVLFDCSKIQIDHFPE